MEAKDAFKLLKTISSKELENSQQQGAANLKSGNIEAARKAISRIEKIQALNHSINQLELHWKQLIPEAVLTEPFPEAAHGHRTPGPSFRLPILRALTEMNGKGKMSLVLDRVQELMETALSDHDCHTLQDGRTIRWKNTAAWERLEMVHSGLLSNQSPTGIWEITELGRKYLQDRQTEYLFK